MAAIRIGQSILYAGRAGPRDGCHPMPNAAFPGDYDDRMENRSYEYILRLPGVRRYASLREIDNISDLEVKALKDDTNAEGGAEGSSGDGQLVEMLEGGG